ncbi:MAG TPA: hypothetical protein DCP92_13815 [Nitrospiraceae bacterium]|jgi:predicted site-specific integrase-resolvase|nr:hypothetical protein [Nitrospiraceae bacterium]
MKIDRPHELTSFTGKSVQTQQRADREKILKAYRLKTANGYYTHEQHLEYVGQKATANKKGLVYFRVSSSGQKGDLIHQESTLSVLMCQRIEKHSP